MQLHLQIAPSSTTIFLIGQDDSAETEIEHALIGSICKMIQAMGIVEEIGVMRAVFFGCGFQLLQEFDVFGGGIQRSVPARDIAYGQAVEFNNDPVFHSGHAFSQWPGLRASVRGGKLS